MNVLISADIEGISGVVHNEHTARDGKEHDRARQLMTGEVNAAIKGCIEAGAKKVIVNDSHGTMRNIYPESLLPEATFILGSTKELGMMQGVQNDIDAALFVGYHTKMGSYGILNHTYSSKVIASISINDIEMGEFGINALMAGHYEVPIVFVSGCNHTLAEARSHIPEIYASQVKESISRTTAENCHPNKARELIQSDVTKALKNLNRIKPYHIEGSQFSFKIDFQNTELADTAGIMPFIDRTGPLRLEYTTDDVIKGYRMIKSLILMCRGIV